MTLQTDAAPVTPMPQRRGATRAVVAGVALVLTCGLVAGLWHWRTGADVFVAGGGSAVDDDWPVGEAIYLGVAEEETDLRGDIEIREIEADILKDEAAVRVEYLLCTVDPSSGVGGVGSVRKSDIEEQCSELVPAQGQRMTLNATPRQQLVMAVTPTRPGAITIKGTTVSYDYGWRVGSEFLTVELVMEAVQP
ncbi:hypothetical protein [Nocardioides lijunqiniae]|uniref:hypothetical protein n=1 Tax=Nocardioides lijunqiniae TaxID=2760832 RepID=UPI0018777237|nr:hypothetical protein [Nocardioides lijunqiniae]